MASVAEPEAKRARTEEGAEATQPPAEAGPEASAAEEEQELETDAPPDKKAKLSEPIVFHALNTTPNLLSGAAGGALSSLRDGGFQYLLAGARGNVAMTTGRYMFEAKIIEFAGLPDDHLSRGRAPIPRHLLKIGVAAAGADLLIGEGEDSACFDSEGCFTFNKQRSPPTSEKFGRDDVVCILLNLESGSANFNTISLFKNGVRASKPQPLPETLKGKALYPALSFKNMTISMNFGPQPIAPLPFVCRMLGGATKSHVTVEPAPAEPKDGKYEVLFPIGLPDEGLFDWVDMFLEKNPQYMELSDRKILEWAEKSGVRRINGYNMRTSNDRPDMGFGIPAMDDLSVRRILQSVVPAQQRNFLVAEVKSNLIKEERLESLARFVPSFKKVAVVIVGEPSLEFRRKQHEMMLKTKQEISDKQFTLKKAAEKQQKELAKRQKALEKAKRKAEKDRKRMQEEMKKKVEEEIRQKQEAMKAAQASAENASTEEKKEDGEAKENGENKDSEEKDKKDMDEDAKDDDEEKKEEEATEEKEQGKDKDEEKKDDETKAADAEEDEDDEEEDAMDEDEEDEDPPTVELTEEEKKKHFRESTIKDLTSLVMSTTFTKFTLPDKAEGFDEIKFEWLRAAKAAEYTKSWITERKLTTRVEDLQPSAWFNESWMKWQRALQSWHTKHTEYKGKMQRKAADAAAAAMKKALAEKNAAEKAAAAAANADEAKEEKAEKEDAEEEDGKKEADEEEEKKVDFDRLDVFGVPDVTDIGVGTPLFRDFTFEDWTLASLRCELHLMVHAFKRDVEDPERVGIHVDHLPFYYQKYYKKAMSSKYFGVDTNEELLDLIDDTVYLDKRKVIVAMLPPDLETFSIFVKLTEEARRYRHVRVDLGDLSAKLKFQQPVQVTQQGVQNRGMGKMSDGGHKGGKGGGKKGTVPLPVRPTWQVNQGGKSGVLSSKPLGGAPQVRPHAGPGTPATVESLLRQYGLDGRPAARPPRPPASSMGGMSFGGPVGAGGKGGKVPCRHFAKGACSYGANCRFLHL